MIVGGLHGGQIMSQRAKYIPDPRAPGSFAPDELCFHVISVFLSCPCHRHIRTHRVSWLECIADKLALHRRISVCRVSDVVIDRDEGFYHLPLSAGGTVSAKEVG